MSTVTLTTTPTILDAGTAYDLSLVNSGSLNIQITIDGGSVGLLFSEILRPGQQVTVYPHGHPVSGFTAAGTSSVDVSTGTNPQGDPATEAGQLVKAANLSDLASASTARTNLGLGTAATHPDTDFLTPSAADAAYKARAVYQVTTYGAVLDGIVDDAASIQAAIDACSAAGGGIVEVGAASPGAAVKCNSSLIGKSGVHLRGRGAVTDLRGTANPMIRLPTSGAFPDRIAISDFTITSPVGDGIVLDTTGLTGGTQLGWPRCTIENVTISDAGGDSFKKVLSGIFETRWINCVSMRAGGTGFNMGTTDDFFIGCTAAGSVQSGFVISGGNNKLTGCKAYGNGLAGFGLAGAGRHLLAACEAQDNATDGFDVVGAWNTLSGCLADSNGTSGFKIEGNNNSISGGVAMYGGGGSGQVTPVGYKLVTGATGNRVEGVSGCTSHVGGDATGNDIRVNIGAGGRQVVTYAATVIPNPYLGETVEITLTGNIAISPPSPKHVGQRLTFDLRQDATGGRTVTFDPRYRTSWTPDTAATHINQITFEYDGTAWVQVASVTGLTPYPGLGITDSFNRADAATLGTADTGQVWTNVRGGASIASNAATGGGTGFANFSDNVAVVDAGASDCTITVKLPLGAHDGEGISFRVIDSSNYWIVTGAGGLVKRVAGTPTNVHAGGAFNALAGDTLGVILNGSSITVTLNGAVQYTETDSSHATATKHGINLEATGDKVEDFAIA